MKKKLLGFYDYTVVLTYIGMLMGLLGIMMAMGDHFTAAILCLMLAGFCDMFDGAIAATKKNRTVEEKRFGIQIDSLSDEISFGVMPAMFLFCIMGRTVIGGAIGMLFALCGLIRLAYYNVMEERRQDETTERREYFQGFPITTVALVLPLAYMLHTIVAFPEAIVFPIVIFILAVGFVLPFRIKKPHGKAKYGMLAIGIVEGVGLIVLRLLQKL